MCRVDLERLSRVATPGFCKECAEAIPPGSRRRVYCSQKCSDLFSMQVKPSFARKWVLKRDKGICNSCGLDCVAHRRDWMHHLKYFNFGDAKGLGKFYDPLQEIPSHKVRNKRGKLTLGTLWDMDHIIPVRDGGLTIPGNLQTLCWWCHQAKTKEMRK